MLNRIHLEKRQKQSVGWLGTESFYIHDNLTVEELMVLLEDDENENIYALAVVDNEMRTKGMVVTRELYSLVGRQYGRAILGKKSVSQIMCLVNRSFDFQQNIFSVGEILEKDLRRDEISYYLLHDKEGFFKGIFSSRDILIHLSNITKSDMIMAQSLQRKISREETSIHESRFDLVAATEPVMDVGGDFYLIKKYRENRWIFSVCDASGKGIAASLLTTTIWGMMSIYDFNKGLMPFLKKVNNYLYTTLDSERFITGIFLDFHADNGKVDLFDMGHSYIFIHRKGKLRSLPLKGNTPIGIQEIESISVGSLQLKEGDYLFIPTDGLMEQQNSQKIVYSRKRIESIINKNLRKPIENIRQEIRQDFIDFKGEEYAHDDMTFLLLKYYGGSATDQFS